MSQAIVIGASFAGLCAAAALARNFERVIVIEREGDRAAETRTPALLCGGQRAMMRLLPAALARLEYDGARRVDVGAGMRWYQLGSWNQREALGIEMSTQTRALLDQRVRESCEELDAVEILRADVDEPVCQRGRVCGIRLEDGEVLDAELVIDASALELSRSPQWLRSWGFGQVGEQAIELGLSCVSGIFELPADEALDEVVAVSPLAQHHRRGGLVVPLEGRRVAITSYGYQGDAPPSDLDGLRRWARTLLQPDVAKLLAHAKLVGSIERHGCSSMVRRSFGGRLRMPRGYLVIGEAACRVDPIFGQDLSVAAMQAELLLALEPGANTRPWQRKLARVADLAWGVCANEALRGHEQTGWDAPLGRAHRWMTAQMIVQASHDRELHAGLVRTMYGLERSRRLFRPAMLRRLARASLHERAQRKREPRPLAMGVPEYMLETHYRVSP